MADIPPGRYITRMPQPSSYRIRNVDRSDLPLLSNWRRSEHVSRWWGDPTVEPEAQKLQEGRVAMWIGEVNSRPFAFIQDYLVSDWAPHHFDDLPAGSRGLDLYIGEADLLGSGHGVALLDLHIANLFASGVPAVGIDPHPDNLPARRAFAKAGFREVSGPLKTRWGEAVLMHRFARWSG